MRSLEAVLATVPAASPFRRCVALAVVVGGSIAAQVMPSTAAAHTDFDYSLPTEGASVGEPVSEITVAFADAVTLVGPGFEVLDPQGGIRQPFAVTDDDRMFRLQLDPPLAGGPVRVHWEVAASDGHALSGSFSFTVVVEAASPTTVSPTSPPTTVPSTPATVSATTGAVTEAPDIDERIGEAVDVGITTADEPPPSDDAGSTGRVIALALAVAIGSGAFVVVRSRR